MSVNLSVEIAGMKFKNPVIAASGTWGFGREYSKYIDLNKIGGISVKGLTLKPRKGNAPPRIAETPAGILNSVGLQNPGVNAFIKEELPFLKSFDTVIIANIAGNTIEEYCEMAKILSETDVDAIELNISCPNVKEGCLTFGTSSEGTKLLTERVKEYCKKPLIVKLSPNVTDISQIAKTAESSGADCISLINTVLGMAIDAEEKKPVLANNVGGLSGPAIKPIALRMVYEVCRSVNIPVIGMGGIMSGNDAVEFFLAGASAIMVGTTNFINPRILESITLEIESYLNRHKHLSVYDIIDSLKAN